MLREEDTGCTLDVRKDTKLHIDIQKASANCKVHLLICKSFKNMCKQTLNFMSLLILFFNNCLMSSLYRGQIGYFNLHDSENEGLEECQTFSLQNSMLMSYYLISVHGTSIPKVIRLKSTPLAYHMHSVSKILAAPSDG